MQALTVEEAIAILESGGARVVRATIHEPEGDRMAWFVGLNGWCHFRTEGSLIAAAAASASPPLVQDHARGVQREWPEAG